MAPFFIDFEAFQHGNEDIIIKELCIVDANNPLIPLYFIFHPIKNWCYLDLARQKTYNYQFQNIHNLGWNEGTSHYCRRCVYYYIKQAFPYEYRNGIFYVMGEQKLNFLKQQFTHLKFCLYNITFDDLPALSTN